ncbi:MAG: SusC/RagA family TonB-linked outer membrane protein [Bacteroidales bacterium]|nr:SusC/RagA family TonB-linked outer membrane protein [Bacteroidales bacterium]
MKQTLLMLLLSVQSFAAVYAQKESFTLNMRDASIKEVIKAISAQSDFSFVYSDADIAKLEKKNISFTNESLTKILDYFLTPSQLEYEISDNIIIIKKSNARQPLQKRPQPQQKREVKGIVKDAYGRPIPGVAVFFKGTKTGQATDVNGSYTLSVPDSGRVMVFSCLGMKSKEVSYRGQATINVVLEEDVVETGDIVVTGVFNKAKESYTGSVTTITSREIQAFRGQNLVQTLKNIDPAINITVDNDLGSNPNNVPQINMRGNSSLPLSVEEYNSGLRTSVNTPLIIMDGFEISLTKLMDYNDEDIESINILKDASATAIYGSRGANGVIVVITKAPQTGKLKINAQAGLSLDIPDLGSYELLNASEILELQRVQNLYYSDKSNPYIYEQESYEMRLKDVLEGVNTDWLHYPVRTGVSKKYNIRLEGGRNEFRWGTSLALNQTAGAMKGSLRNNFNGAITLSYTYNKIIFKNQLSVGINKGIESPYGTFSTYANMQPYYKPYDEYGKLNKDFMGLYYTSRVGNPLYDATLNSRDESRYTELINNFSIEWSIVKNLNLRAQIGISKNISETDYFLSARHSSFDTSEYETDEGYFRKGTYRYGTGNTLNYDASVTMSYSKQLKEKHSFYAGIDYSLQNRTGYQYRFIIEGFPNDNMDFLGSGMQYEESGMPYGSESTTRRIGLTANINYIYDNRYYADLSYRMDGSSQFGSKNRFAPFWSVGLGWNLHREKFLKDSDFITSLRLKTSYGQTGSQQFSAYQALQTYQFYTGDKYLNRGGAYLMAIGNENLKWQMTDQFNIGTEISILNSRFNGTFDYYTKKTSSLLSSRDLPRSTGYDSYIDNIGAVTNHGFEAGMNYYIIRNTENELIWMVGAKLAYNKNKISKLSEAIKEQTEEYKAQDVDVSTLFYEGYAQNSIWAVRSLGVDPSTGNELFLDANGNITETWYPSAKVYCGISEPLYRGNISSMLRYKNLTLNLSFGYNWGGQVYNQTLINKVEVTRSVLGQRNVDKRVLSERWTQPGDLTFFKGFSNTATRATSRFVMDDSVFELQSASLQYRIVEGGFLQKNNIQSIIIGLNTSDLFYFSSVKRERGTNYPFARRIGASLSIMF